MRSVVLMHLLCWVLGFGGIAQAKQEPYNVDIFFGWGGCFRPTEWTPIEVGVGSLEDEPFAGHFQMALPQDMLNTLHVSHPVVLTPGLPAQIPLVGRMALTGESCDFQLISEQGQRVWSNRIPLLELPADRMKVVENRDLLVGVVGERRFGLLKLEQEAASVTQGDESGISGRVFVADKLPRSLPWDWTGYASLDFLICYDPDWSQLRSQQFQALADWVSKGGRLLLISGQRAWPGDNPLTRLISVTPGPLKQIQLTPTLLQQWGLPRDNPPQLSVTPLRPEGDQRHRDIDQHGGDILRFTRAVGFGRITVLGYDPRQLTTDYLDHSSAYWLRQVESLLAVPRGRGLATVSMGRTLRLRRSGSDSLNDPVHHFGTTKAQNANNSVLTYLYSIDQMRPLSIGWVVGLLVLLAILMGPVDYWVLKKLDRQPLTWLTCAGWIVLFTLGAYYGVQALRAGDLQLRIVSVTDTVAGSDTGWRTQYSGIFAPKSDDYPLTGLDSNQWWSALAPSRNVGRHSGGQYRRRDMFCVQQDGSNIPVSIPVSIWTMQCLRNETPVASLPLSIDMDRQGEEIQVTVANDSEFSFPRAAVVFRDQQGLELGSLPSGEITSTQGRVRSLANWRTESDVRRQLGLSDLFTAEGCYERTLAMEAYLEAGAAVLIVERSAEQAPFELAAPDCQTHYIDIQRFVVFPNIARNDP